MGEHNGRRPVENVLPQVVAAIEYIRAFDEVHMHEPRDEYKFTCEKHCSVETEAQVRFLEEVYRHRETLRKRALFETFPLYFVGPTHRRE